MTLAGRTLPPCADARRVRVIGSALMVAAARTSVRLSVLYPLLQSSARSFGERLPDLENGHQRARKDGGFALSDGRLWRRSAIPDGHRR
jgi:hypothetical protein